MQQTGITSPVASRRSRAYEYTPFSEDTGNLHRNVIFEGTERLPREPFSVYHSVNPEGTFGSGWMSSGKKG